MKKAGLMKKKRWKGVKWFWFEEIQGIVVFQAVDQFLEKILKRMEEEKEFEEHDMKIVRLGSRCESEKLIQLVFQACFEEHSGQIEMRLNPNHHPLNFIRKKNIFMAKVGRKRKFSRANCLRSEALRISKLKQFNYSLRTKSVLNKAFRLSILLVFLWDRRHLSQSVSESLCEVCFKWVLNCIALVEHTGYHVFCFDCLKLFKKLESGLKMNLKY